MTPLVSVIIPVYNTAPYLRRALDSVRRQTLKDLEILCIDDGSTDECATILAEYAARDSRIKLITHAENLGIAHAMNSGFDAARGETIGIVDSDDVIGKNFFAELWKVYVAGVCDVVKGRRKERETDGTWHEMDLNTLIREDGLNFTWQWTTAIYRTSLIRKHGLQLSTEFASGQDTLFLHQLMGHEPSIGFSDKAIYYYLRNESSITQSRSDEFYLNTRIMIARLLKKYLPEYPHKHQRRKVFGTLIKFLSSVVNSQFKGCDWAPHFPVIQSILSNDEFYTPQREFPFLSQALKATNIQELRAALKFAATYLDAKTLRDRVRRKHS